MTGRALSAVWASARPPVGGQGTMRVTSNSGCTAPTPMTLNRRLLMQLVLTAATLVMPALGMAQAQDGAQDGARLVEGQSFAGRVRLFNTELQLNGTGVRAVAWFKGYAVGLYLPERASTAAQVLAQAGPKRLQLRMLQDVPAAEFVKALQKGIERNSPAGEWAALQPRVQRFAEQINASGPVHKRDTVDLDFDPARGLLFARNGKLAAEPIPGADLYAALLRAFIGEHPYDERMKAGLLAQPARNAP